jgi:DNA-binding NarL/FixJ family response regulator
VAIRVLLVDDQPLLRTGFRMILEAEQDLAVVGEAGDGLQALDQVRALQPDVVLMDIRMPRMDGVEATRQITGPGRDGPAKVLVLTTFDLDEYVVEALRAGASGFLLKDAPANELVQAIRVVAAGEAMLAPSITRRPLDKYAGHLPSGEEPVPDTLHTLTDREVEVLKLVARGLSNAEIAADLFVSETTVKTHVGHVLTYDPEERDLRAVERKVLALWEAIRLATETGAFVPRRLQLVYLGSGDVVTYDPVLADLERVERKLHALWDAIRQATETGEWRPRPTRLCGWCDHQAHCPEFGGTPPPYPLPVAGTG